MSAFLMVLMVFGLTASTSYAFVTIMPKPEAAKPQAAAQPKADAQDLILCAEAGLYKVRLHVSVDGRSPTANVNAFLDRAFAFFDLNGDKALDAREVARLPPPFAFMQGGNFIFNGRQPGPRPADLDSGKDGKVDRQEFALYFRRNGLAALQVSVQPPNAQAEQSTAALYKRLAPGRNFLTQAELGIAWERLQKLDADEDEIVTADELMQRVYNPFYGGQFEEVYYGGGRPGVQSAAAFIGLTPGEPAGVSAAKVLQSLQAARRTYLVLAAPRLSPKTPGFVARALRELDLAALTAFLEQPPDMELTAPLGSIAAGIGRVLGRGNDGGVRLKPTGRNPALEKATAVGADGRLRLTTPGEMVEFLRSPNVAGDQTQYYRQQFKTEAGDKEYLDRPQLQQSPQLQFIANIFDYADRDGDGKLFVKELNAFFDLLQAGSTCRVTVQVLDQGRSLFALVDANHDQRLARRELLEAVRKYSAFDRDGDGKLARGELPRQLRVSVGQGNGGVVFAPVLSGMMGVPATPGATKGPAWFRKMDRNKDGDVSRREFLGTPEEFRPIDADGDGLISAAEAEKFQKEIQDQASKK